MKDFLKEALGELGLSARAMGQIPNIIEAILVLIIGVIVIKIFLRIMKKALEKSSVDPVLYRFSLTAVKVVLYISLLLMILGKFTDHLSGVITVLAAAGAAIALALKDSLANIAGGMMILITKPFTQNDFIDIGGTTGQVREIDLFVTHLKTFDNKAVTIPNGMVNTSVLTNYSQENKRRVDCCFRIGYHDNIEQGKSILAEIAACNPDIYTEPKPVIGVAGQRDSYIELDLKVWCATENYDEVKYFLEENVKLAFDEAGIAIPYPQLDVSLSRKKT